MSATAEWVTAIATTVAAVGAAVTAFGIIFLWKQADLLRKQIVADHERSRRENAINYLFEWSKGLLQANSLARKLGEKLTEAQTLDLLNEKPLRLNITEKSLVLGVLSKIPEGGLKETTSEVLLGEKEVSEIRWQLLRYLNNLESIFAAARHNVADEEILIEQFGFLASPREGHHVLKRFREAAGAENYPSLSELEKKLEERHKVKSGKPPVDKKFQPHS